MSAPEALAQSKDFDLWRRLPRGQHVVKPALKMTQSDLKKSGIGEYTAWNKRDTKQAEDSHATTAKFILGLVKCYEVVPSQWTPRVCYLSSAVVVARISKIMTERGCSPGRICAVLHEVKVAMKV